MGRTREDVWGEEAQVLQTLRKRMKKPHPTVAETSTPFRAGSVDLSQLVQIRRIHQTRRAKKSVRSNMDGREEPEQPTAGTQRRKLCMQMADVIHRANTGLQRELRWKSGSAPGTKDSTEVSLLKGNSANAELAAGERVKAVKAQSYHRGVMLTMLPSVPETSEGALSRSEPFEIPK